jgi:hypothetical protein
MILIYTYRNGTVAPPHHYEITIRLEPGKPAVYEFRPGYTGATGIPTWKESFPCIDGQRAALQKKLIALGLTRRWREIRPQPDGGGYSTLKVTFDGRTFEVPSFATDATAAQKIFQAVEEIVPPGLVRRQKTRFEAAKKISIRNTSQ